MSKLIIACVVLSFKFLICSPVEMPIISKALFRMEYLPSKQSANSKSSSPPFRCNTNSIYFSLILRRSGRACETRHVLIRPMKSGFVPLPDLRNNETLLIRNGIKPNSEWNIYLQNSPRILKVHLHLFVVIPILFIFLSFFVGRVELAKPDTS